MKSTVLGVIFYLVCHACLNPCWAAAEPGRQIKVFTVEEDFASVKQAVLDSIEGHGLVLSHISTVGEMLQRTGKDLGHPELLYLQAENLEFCSALYSRKMMTADPFNVMYCPFVISVFVLPKSPETVYVTYRVPMPDPSKDMTWVSEVDAFLNSIVEGAIE